MMTSWWAHINLCGSVPQGTKERQERASKCQTKQVPTILDHSWKKNTGSLKTGSASVTYVSVYTDTDWSVLMVLAELYWHAHVCVRVCVSTHVCSNTCGRHAYVYKWLCGGMHMFTCRSAYRLGAQNWFQSENKIFLFHSLELRDSIWCFVL